MDIVIIVLIIALVANQIFVQHAQLDISVSMIKRNA